MLATGIKKVFLLVFLILIIIHFSLADTEIDYFNRGDNAVVDNGWSETESGGTWAIDSNTVKVVCPAGVDQYLSRNMNFTQESNLTWDIKFNFTKENTDTLSSYFGICTNARKDYYYYRADAGSCIAYDYGDPTKMWRLYQNGAVKNSTLAQNLDVNSTYTIRFMSNGTALFARIWHPTTETEPEEWNLSYVITPLTTYNLFQITVSGASSTGLYKFDEINNITAGTGADNTPPTIFNFNSNATTTPPAYNEWYNVSFTCSDDVAVSCLWYQTRNSSGSVNSTPNCSSAGNFYAQVLNLQTRGETVYLKPYCYDTSNNTNTNVDEINFTVANTLPSLDNLQPASGLHDFKNISINFTYTDADSDLGDCYFYINNTLKDSQSDVANGTFVSFLTNLSENGAYAWNVTCTDGFGAVSEERLFVLDTINPIITWHNPARDNTTFSNQDLSLNISCSDLNLYLLEINVTDSSGSQIHYNLSNATGETLSVHDFISLSAESNYTVSVACSDQHTAEVIPDYGFEKDILNKKLNYDTGDNKIGVSLKTSDVNLNGFDSEKLTDRYTFTYDFSSAEAGPERTFVFILNAEQPLVYLKNSKYKAHFISGKNWIDFNLNDDSAEYVVNKINDNQFEISITTSKTLLAFNSIGGLNIVKESAIYAYDLTSPLWSGNVINDTAPHRNDWIKYSVFWEDNNVLNYAWLEHNLSGGSLITSDLTYLNASEYNFTVEKQVTAAPGATVCLRAYANDTAGNQNVSSLDCYTVANTAPVVNSVSATSPQGFGENVAITANVTDPDGQQYLSLVKVGIIPPGGAEVNYSMWNTSSEIWTLNNFTDYHNGTYSYTVYAIDNLGLMDSASGTFEMYDNLTISIFPLEMSYNGNDLVVITDPPGEWLTSETGFDDGTYSHTHYNSTVNAVMLSTSQSSGTYTSKVYDASSAAEWDSIEWSSGAYQEELSYLEGDVLLLHMNDNWSDSSSTDNNGLANGGATFSTSSKFGSHAGSFDGNGDYVNTSINNFPVGNENITVEAWFKINGLNSNNNIVTYGTNAAHSAIQLLHRTSDDKLVVQYWGGYGIVTASLNDNNWHHAVGIHAGNSNYLYLDGSLAGSIAYSSANLINSFNYIGKVPGDPTYDFDGLIDELAVYNRGLSSAEVLEHYKRGALRLNLSVRSCNDSACSGESFVDVNGSSPQNLNAANNTYFQYKFDFSTSNLAYSPELYNVTVNYALEVPPDNQSKLRNDAVTDTSIYLLMKVQYWNDSWVDEAVRYFGFLQVQPGEANQLKLDQYWQNWSTFDRIGYGTHRVYAAALDDENNTITNIDGSLIEAYHNFTVVNTVPTTPVLLYPANDDAFIELPEFNWSGYDADADAITYSIEIDNTSSFDSPEYTNSSIAENASGVTGITPTLPIMYTYFWRVKASDGYAESSWSSVRNFTYVVWNVSFNVTGSEIDRPERNNVNISGCNYTGFNQSGDTTNMYGPYAFPPGDWECDFELELYFGKTQVFSVNQDEIINVILSETGGATYQEHTWLEALYNCIILKDCDLYNLLLEINQTVGNVWEHTKPTNENVVTTETITNKVVNSTQNLTIDYTINIPIKAGYPLGSYLPVRIGYWFLDITNTSCYNQGDRPIGVADPYCQPLVIETVGPMGGSVSFTVELQPSLPAGNYSIKRMIDIDPQETWINYGQEEIDTVTVNENMDNYGIGLEQTGEENPLINDNQQQSTSSGGSSGGGGGSSNSKSSIIEKIVTPITNIYQNITNIILPQEDKPELKTGDENGEQKSLPEESKPDSTSFSGITGAAINSLQSNLSLVGVLTVICLVFAVLTGYFYAKSRKK